ncbi:MAG: DUF2478 domain-containing protein [Rhodopseudomonas palustris]|uniref:DUF2478 domain-containing protein n=1 Tax=Rhodopseudomonas palustris TaxID=1076 RepID=A0A933S1G0_RHOPL|nr:DUF2478 domain-containing protein [Rhodopseudomonas palustris]
MSNHDLSLGSDQRGAPSKPGRAFDPVDAAGLRPGVIVHDPAETVDDLLEAFARGLQARGFKVAGYVQKSHGEGSGNRIDFLDLATGTLRDGDLRAGVSYLQTALKEQADLLVIGRFAACLEATDSLKTVKLTPRLGQTLPMLTAIAGHSIHQWHSYARREGAMIAPDLAALWQWWGPEQLYRDLALGVADDEVRQIACGQRWIMVEGPHGSGLAYLPRHPRDLLPRLNGLAKQSLKQLAAMATSWNPLETALAVAAINAHYNRYDLAAFPGNGVKSFRHLAGRVGVIGAFPGVDGMLPNCAVMEADPRPGEYPLAAMDSILPACDATIVNASSLINRTLPRVLRLSQHRPVALIGPATPMTPRLFDYGLSVLGGLIVSDPKGLASAIRAGALPREFSRFGRFVHLTRGSSPAGAAADPADNDFAISAPRRSHA